MTSLDMLGYAAGTITSITFLPQVIHVYKLKSAKAVSLNMLLLLILGVSMWLIFGILQKNGAIIYTNSMVLVMAIILLLMKWKYDR